MYIGSLIIRGNGILHHRICNGVAAEIIFWHSKGVLPDVARVECCVIDFLRSIHQFDDNALGLVPRRIGAMHPVLFNGNFYDPRRAGCGKAAQGEGHRDEQAECQQY